ncbi:MAG: hypothetical protein HDT02_03635 [Bacteroidales bacterium]|nr:hypothetical protein [Bacteroidales bacterium]
MSRLLKSDSALRAIIPNIAAVAEGAASWMQRLEPFLCSAEDRLEVAIDRGISALASPQQLHLAKIAVAWDAWFNAIPSLDLVVTPTGFAVTSNNNLAPASRDRVAAAREQARKSADNALLRIIHSLVVSGDWSKSPVTTLADPVELSKFFPEAESDFSLYSSLQSDIHFAEASIVSEYFSPRLLDWWHHATLHADSELVSPEDLSALSAFRVAVVSVVRKESHSVWPNVAEVIRILSHSPKCRSALLFALSYNGKRLLKRSAVFENDKDSSGFFFV